MDFFNKMADMFIKANRRLKRWQRVVSALSAIVVFITTYSLVLPAITLDKDTASTQSGMEIAASDQESGSDGTVYESEPEEEPVEASAEDSQEESAADDSGSQEAEVSEEQSSDEKAEDYGQDTSSNEEESAAETGKTVELPAADGTSESAKTVEEVQLITEKTQLSYQYIDESFGKDPEDDVDDGYTVYAEFGADAKLPVGVELKVKEITKESNPELYEAYYEKALSGLQDKYDEKTALSFARFYDIKFVYNGEEVEPSGDVKVRIEYKKAVEIEKETNVDAVHFDKNNDEEPEVIESEVNKSEEAEAEKKDKEDTDIVKTVDFESAHFSVYGIIGSYTVDFHWEVDGKTYEFSIPGGGFVSFTSLAEVLEIAEEASGENEKDNSSAANGLQTGNRDSLNDIEISELTKEFVSDVENLTFSNPELVWVGAVDKDTTVGKLKEVNGLECEYSAELTEEQIEEINAQTVKAGDWALISMHPFLSEESLTVTMKNGDQFVVRVTDAQDPYGLDGQNYEIIVNGNRALNPVSETETIGGITYNFLNNANPSSGSNLSWHFEFDQEAFDGHGGYYISHEGQYLKMIGTDENDTSRTVTLVSDKADATPISIVYDRAAGKYSFSNTTGSTGGYLCQFNTDYFGVAGSSENNANAWMELRNPENVNVPGFVSPWDVRGDNIKIKLFDYTGTVNGSEINTKWASGAGSPSAQNYRDGNGVNKGRTLLFTGSGRDDASDPYNYYTGQSPAVMQGIVSNHLGEDGYPELTNTVGSKGASLGYLFGAGGQDGVTAYTGTDGNGLAGLLRKDENGYYYYSSEQNYATLVEDEIKLYSESYDKDSPSENARKIGFFPFDPYRKGQSKAGEEKGPNGSPYNHQFGMTMEATFVLPPDGKLPNGEDMQFNFSGDDDVWVFIDDVLVLDLGGVHQPLSGTINFAGEGYSSVTDAAVQKISGQTTVGNGKSLAELFEAAGEEYDDSPYSSHTIKFYYLERGGCDSNCTLSFNLLMYKTLTVAKELEGLTDEERAKYANNEFTCDIYVNGDLYNGSDTIRYDAAGNVVEEGFEIVDGKVDLKPGERVRIIGLQPNDIVQAAEENGLSMTEFYPPRAERFYQDEDKNQHEEEIDLSEEHSESDSEISDWRTKTYPVENLEELMFTNTLKEKNLDVEKTWSDGAAAHSEDEVKFKVIAKVKIDDQEYDYTDTIAALYSDKTVKDQKILDVLNTTYTLSAANEWKAQLEHLPGVNNLQQEIFYEVAEVQTANGYASTVTGADSHNIDVVKIFPKDHTFEDEEIRFKLRKGTEGNYQYYNEDNNTWGSSASATVYTLNSSNNYTQRFHDFPAGTYSYEEVGNNQDGDNSLTDGLVVYDRALKKFDILNGPFNIEVKKTWNPASCANENVAGRKVEIELGRYTLMAKEGNLTIKKEGVPSDASFRATYTVTNKDTDEVYGIYPYVPGGITVKVPEGNYKIEETILEDDESYTSFHEDPIKDNIAIQDTGSTQVVYTSRYVPIVGSLTIKSTLDPKDTGVSYDGVSYEVYDASGTKVETLTFAEVSGETGYTLETRIGRYTVREVNVPATPENVKVTLRPKKPADANREVVAIVKTGGESATAEFTATYEKKAVRAHVTVTSTNNGVNKQGDFTVGDTIRISYQKNQSETINAPSVTGGVVTTASPVEDEAPGGGNRYNGRYHVDIRLTDPNVSVLFTNPGIGNGWSAMNNDNVSITLVSSGRGKSLTAMFARKLAGPLKAFQPTYKDINVENTAQPPEAPAGKKYVKDESFTHEKITLQYSNSWSEVLNDLPSVDANGNPYYYYIKSVHEVNMPATAVSQITLNGDNLLLVGPDNASTDLEVTNTVDTTGDLKVQKTGTVNSATPTEANKKWIDGVYNFTISGKTGTPTANNRVQLSITLENGAAVSAQKTGTSTPESVTVDFEDGIVTVRDLPEGEYSVAETLTAEQIALGIALSSSSNTEVEVYADQTTSIPTASFVNNIDLGKLNVKKSVTINGHAPSDDSQKQILAGTYNFKVYTNQNCSDEFAVKENGEDLILSVEIEEDGATKSSRTIVLPVGTYWVKEIVPKDSLILPVGSNPQEVTVTADNTTTASAEFTNDADYNEEDDDITVDIVKQFTGLENKNEIPEGYQAVLTYKLKNGTEVEIPLNGESYQHTSGVHVKTAKSEDGLTWSWHVYRIPDGSTDFSVHEENYTNKNYTLSVTINGESVNPDTGAALDITVPVATFTPVDQERITAEATLRKYYVGDDYLLLVSVNPHGTVVLSNSSLNYQAREAIKAQVEDGSLSGSFSTPVRFFSTEQHQTVIRLDNKRTITVTQEDGKYVVQLPPNTNSQAEGYSVKYDQQDAVNNAEIVNDYTGKEVPVEIIKVDKDTMDQQEKEYLKEAKFTITQLDETGSGTYKVKPDSTTTPKELYYQEIIETDTQGKAVSSNLKPGYYEIKETKAPEGYQLMSDLFFIKVKGGKITRIKKTDGLVINWPDEDDNSGIIRFTPALEAQEADPDHGIEGHEATNASFLVGNTPGTSLPHTGGPGTRLFTLIGAMLIAFAGFGIIVRKRRVR